MNLRKLIGIAALTIATTASAGATTLDPSPDAPGRAVVNAVFRDYLSQIVGVQVQTALVDVDSDGVAEIIARFVHSGSCRGPSTMCRTVILRFHDQKWGLVLDRPADRIDVGKSSGRFAFAPVTIDGVKWSWNDKAYAPTPGTAGEIVTFSPVPSGTVGPIAVAFGEGAVKLAAVPTSGISFEYARPKVSEKGEHILVRMQGKDACGVVAGCPVRLLEKDGQSWRPVLSGSSIGGVEISRTFRDGRKDIVLGTTKGYVVMGWTGKTYGIADLVEATQAPKK